MSESKGIFLLSACFLLLTIMGLAYAQVSPITITTDKTTYHPGESVYVTVKVTRQINGTSITVEIVPASGGSVFHPTVSGTVSLSGGTVALTLPNGTTPGNYDAGILVVEGMTFTLDPFVGITVTNPTVPESPSVLGLLLPALLVGVYVLRRKKRTEAP